MAKSKVRIVERKKFVNTIEGPKVSHALEDYLKSIYQLAEEAQPVIAARIAAETGVSPSTIFMTLQRLAREGERSYFLQLLGSRCGFGRAAGRCNRHRAAARTARVLNNT